MDYWNEAGQSAWEHCSTEELVAMGLLCEADVEEMMSDLGAAIEAQTLPMAA
jgi:hypothetical protein